MHCEGLVHTEGKTRDEAFDIYLDQAIKIKREVQVYQWVETKKTRKDSEGREVHEYEHK